MSNEIYFPRLLTVEEVEAAITELPPHRTDLRCALKNTVALIKRGVPIKDNSPAWQVARNVVFVSKIDGDVDNDASHALCG